MIRKIAFVIMLILLVNPSNVFSYQKTLSFTDKEIIESLTKLEEGQRVLVEEQRPLREDINKRFEDIDKRFNLLNKRITDLIHITSTMMVVFDGLVVAMMGLVFWGRRSLIEKAKNITIEYIETDSRLIKALRELSKTDKKLVEVMRSFRLL